MRDHIKKRSKDSYTIIVPLGRDPATGKYRQHWETSQGTKVTAEKRLAELQLELSAGAFIKPEKITVAEYLIHWLDDMAKPRLSPTTYECYRYIITRHINPSLGKIPLAKLSTSAVQHYYATKLKQPRIDGKGTLTARSVRAHHRVLHRALRSAVTGRLVAYNAADNTEPPVPINKEMRPMTESQMMTFLSHIKGYSYYEMLYLCLFTGLRRSELLALRWDDIDLDNGHLTVNRALHHIKGQFVISEPKTEKSKATIALTPSTVDLLADYKQRRIGESFLWVAS